MSGNPVKRTVPGIERQTQKLEGGLEELGDELDITNFPTTVIVPLRTSLEQTSNAYRAARDAERNANGELRRAAEPGRAFVKVLVSVFRPVLGWTWNSSWQQLGFIEPSLAVPKSYDKLSDVLRVTTDYLTTHPAAEVASRGVTTVIVSGLYTAMKDATKNVTSAENETTARRQEFDAAMKAMQDGVSGLIGELGLKLTDTDARWKAFGLNIPGYPAVPGQVLNLVVTPGLPGTLWLKWDTTPRGARFQVEMLESAPEAEWELVATVGETSVTLTDLTPGATVQLRVVAVNDGGEGVPSEPVQATVPMAQAA